MVVEKAEPCVHPALTRVIQASANTSNALVNLISKHLDPNTYAVATGAVPPVAQVGLHPFHSGCVVGKVVALKQITPCALEPGGASP